MQNNNGEQQQQVHKSPCIHCDRHNIQDHHNPSNGKCKFCHGSGSNGRVFLLYFIKYIIFVFINLKQEKKMILGRMYFY